MVPGFGAFLTQQKSAVIDEETHTFYPPIKVLSFNRQLVSNDGLLVSYAAESQRITFDEMLAQVEEEVEEWKLSLEKGKRVTLSNIGHLWTNAEGKIQFQPEENTNYLTATFGMSSLALTPITREILKEEITELEDKIPFTFTPEARETGAFKPYLKYAAVVLLALTTGFAGFQWYKKNQDTQQLAWEEAQQQVSKRIQEATFFDAAPLELPTITLKTAKKATVDGTTSSQKVHHIIAGAFRYRTNADKKIAQLKKQGFNPAYLGTNPFGLHMVAYDSFNEAEKALEALHRIKRTQKDAWLKSVR